MQSIIDNIHKYIDERHHYLNKQLEKYLAENNEPSVAYQDYESRIVELSRFRSMIEESREDMVDNNSMIDAEVNKLKIAIKIPSNITLGDLKSVKGSLYDAASFYIDWDKLYGNNPNAIGTPGLILMAIASNIEDID